MPMIFNCLQQSETVTLMLNGSIDENFCLNQIQIPSCKNLIIDFKEIKSINSCGIRDWIKWIHHLPTELNISYVFCPKVMIDQINVVRGIVPPNGRIKSFYVPYINASGNHEEQILFRDGKEYIKDQIFFPTVVDKKTGQPLEIDVIEEKYFFFLSQM